MSNNTQAQDAKYFDLHTTGIGYLNRIREVPIRRGEPFLAASVASGVKSKLMALCVQKAGLSSSAGVYWPLEVI